MAARDSGDPQGPDIPGALSTDGGRRFPLCGASRRLGLWSNYPLKAGISLSASRASLPAGRPLDWGLPPMK